ncbi:hypothetical protein HII31_07876 [Pseudocercospora fuligena]|uniref:Uncharacterized protein n=1 Tax=Pseudocercospora fuligena TaxID=685502 RepID=A0A8H6RHL7_9PEZI|nr:hypothetical protein HII31_07876 [Pseudocercospora fuligena]
MTSKNSLASHNPKGHKIRLRSTLRQYPKPIFRIRQPLRCHSNVTSSGNQGSTFRSVRDKCPNADINISAWDTLSYQTIFCEHTTQEQPGQFSRMDPEYFNRAFLPTSRNHPDPPVAFLLNLPFELRHRILIYALKQKGTIELQYPVWAGLQVFDQPLFQTCRSLRSEAVKAFYETNDFLWVIDVENKSRSDPSAYSISSASTGNLRQASPKNYAYTIPNCLPWEYPDLMQRLRHLQINIYLPSNDQNACLLQDRLSALVQSLDLGRRLASLHVLVTAKRRAAQIPLSQDGVLALEVLARMEVRGKVDVQTRYYFRVVSASVNALQLARRMKG